MSDEPSFGKQIVQALGGSTSARLRRLEQQLTEMTAVAKEARHELAHARFELDQAKTRLAHTDGSETCAWRGLAEDLMREPERAGQIYAARGPSGTCVLCDGPIVRGQAVESVAGQTKPAWAHAACPDPEGEPS